MLKRVGIALVFLFVIVMSVVCVAENNSVFAAQMPFADSFDTYTGGAPEGWTVSKGSCVARTIDSEHGVSLEMAGNSQLAISLSDFANQSNRVITFSTDLYLPALGEVNLWSAVQGSPSSWRNPKFIVIKSDGRVIKPMNNYDTVDGTTEAEDTLLGTVEAGKWYNFKIIVNFRTFKYDAYINGVLVGSDLRFQYNINNMSSFSHYNSFSAVILDNATIDYSRIFSVSGQFNVGIEKITDFGMLSPSDVVENRVTFSNSTGAAKNVILLTVLYKNGNIEELKYNVQNIPSSEQYSAITVSNTVSLPSEGIEGCTIQSFVWEEADNMKPLAEAGILSADMLRHLVKAIHPDDFSFSEGMNITDLETAAPDSNGIVFISGTADAFASRQVSLIIVKTDALKKANTEFDTLAELISAMGGVSSFFEDVIYIGQKPCDIDGTFDFSYAFDKNAEDLGGWYTAFAGGSGVDDLGRSDFYYATPDEMKRSINAINDATAEDMPVILQGWNIVLGLNMKPESSFVHISDKTPVYTALAEETFDPEKYLEELERIRVVFNNAVKNQALAEAVMGDVDENGDIDLNDIVLVFQLINGDSVRYIAADVNRDGRITYADAQIIGDYLVKKISHLSK